MKLNARSSDLQRPFAVLCSTVLWLAAASLFPGCGPVKPEFSPETKQTPESLAQEFMFRYQSLPAQASGKAKARASAIEKAKAKLALNDSDEKAKGARDKAAKKAAPTMTLDALIDALEAKLGEVHGTSKAEVAKTVAERLKFEPTIDEADRAVISERLGKVAKGS